jgi:hypothetical protein
LQDGILLFRDQKIHNAVNSLDRIAAATQVAGGLFFTVFRQIAILIFMIAPALLLRPMPDTSDVHASLRE